MNWDVLGVVGLSLMALCPIAIFSGYAFRIRWVWRLPDRKAHIRRIIWTNKLDPAVGDSVPGVLLVLFGAVCGLAGIICVLVIAVRSR